MVTVGFSGQNLIVHPDHALTTKLGRLDRHGARGAPGGGGGDGQDASEGVHRLGAVHLFSVAVAVVVAEWVGEWKE